MSFRRMTAMCSGVKPRVLLQFTLLDPPVTDSVSGNVFAPIVSVCVIKNACFARKPSSGILTPRPLLPDHRHYPLRLTELLNFLQFVLFQREEELSVLVAHFELRLGLADSHRDG